jgi:putative FmdB family regulatory protein
MPIYEYQCQACSHDIEVIQKISDPPLVECPSCGESALKKKISAAAFRLKGGGWYETDFKTGDKKNIAGDKSSSEAKSSDGASGETRSTSGAGKGSDSKSPDSSSSRSAPAS